jgi:catechol 2,3-dioxygenase-like lactoylglutathione lyase family enzyme
MRIHVSLPVGDLDASVRFYEAFLDTPASKRQPGYANFRLSEPPLHLALVAGAGAQDDGTRHYGIEVGSQAELDRWSDRLRARNLVAREEEGETCCYARANKLWVADPDGRQWEVWLRLADADTMKSSSTACCTG